MIVAAAVSGGMDSLLALALLKERGAEVVAVHGYFLPEKDERAADALRDQCDTLGVPFHAFDLRERFAREVTAPFAEAYARGLTPNPCAACNPAMKFGALFDAARELGATHLATGHYARILDHPDVGRLLVRGADPAKDQSYFLSLLGPDRLARAVFPLGGMHKRDVPGELARRGLVPAHDSESQEICFIPNDDYQRWLEQSGAALPGPGEIVLSGVTSGGAKDGTVVGRHHGLWRYTQGQRRGIGVAHSEPLYVLDKDLAANRLVVGPRSQLMSTGCAGARPVLYAPPERWPDEVLVQTRYRQRPVPARVEVERDSAGPRLVAWFHEPGERTAPGQVLAVYTRSGAVLAAARIGSAPEPGSATGQGA